MTSYLHDLMPLHKSQYPKILSS